MRIEPTFSPAKEQLKTIEHESLSGNASPKTFGKRHRVSADASVSKDFFTKTNTSSPRPNFIERRSEPRNDNSFIGFLMTSGLPIKSIAAVFTIALALPMTFIAITERQSDDGIDYMTTASISKEAGFDIKDVSMTKLMKSSSTIITVYGRLENSSGKNKALKPLWVTLYDKDRKIVQSWQHRIAKAIIKDGHKFRFMTSAIDYSGDAKHVTVSTTAPK